MGSPKTWRLADLGTKHALLREGIGSDSMPLAMIAGDLMAGTLVRLPMPDHPGGTYRFSGIWRRHTPPTRQRPDCWASWSRWARMMRRRRGWATSDRRPPASGARPVRSHGQAARSNRSAFITLVQAATKSFTNLSPASADA